MTPMSLKEINFVKFWYILKKYTRPILKSVLPRSLWLRLEHSLPRRVAKPAIEDVFTNEWREARAKVPWNHISQNLEKGVNIIGYLQAATGLGEAARSSILALQAEGVPFSVLDYEIEIPVSQRTERAFLKLGSPNLIYNTSLIHINPPQLPYVWDHLNRSWLVGRYHIGIWYWELPEFPDELAYSFNLVDEIWVATTFVQESIMPKAPVPVLKIPPCIQAKFNPGLIRADFGLPEGVFLFLCAYDVLSVQARKNPQAAIDAFKRAFNPYDQAVGLVVKINNAQENAEGVKQLKDELKNYTNCYFIEEIFPKEKFNAMLNLVDAYISLHRSEGFGLIPAEAMYLGKPVVMTNWSGNVDFMTQDNSCGVNYELIPVGEGTGMYQANQLWADPDIDQARDFMVKLYQNPEYYSLISKRAKAYIQTNYSPEVIGNKMKERLLQVGLL